MPIPSSGEISLVGVRRATRFGDYDSSNAVSNVSIAEESSKFSLTAPHEMSELRTRNGFVSGTVNSIYNQNLSSSSSWSLKSHTISSLYKDRTVRVVWRYINGTQGTSYIGDFQLDDFNLLGNTYSPETGTENFETSTSTGTTNYTSVSFSSLGSGGSAYRWNRDASGTSSGGTGLTSGNTGSWYFYAEVSGSSSLTLGGNYWLRSPSIVVGDNLNISYYIGHLGSNVGNYYVYVEVVS